MTGQEWATLAIAGTAAAWLAWRWRRRGLDEDADGSGAHGCGSCPKSPSDGPPPPAAARRASPGSGPQRPPPARP
jgi:hypothetical protein